jgi:hypothetical protein
VAAQNYESPRPGDLASSDKPSSRHRRLPGLIVVCFGQFWVRGPPFPNYEAPGAPISEEKHTSMAPRPRRQSQNPPLQKSSAIPA